MWSNRKARFTIVMAVWIGSNVALWLAHQVFGYAMKDHPGVFTSVFVIDCFMVLGFAFVGLLASWLSAFYPEAYLRRFERALAEKNAKQNLG